MTHTGNPFGQVLVALVTPMTADGEVDWPAVEKHMDDVIVAGADGIVVTGTTGETSTLTDAEKIRLVEVGKDVAAGRAKIITGGGSNETAHAIELYKASEKVGADGIMIVTPYYNKPTQQGLVEHYRLLAKAHPGFPIMAYNVPGRTGVDLLPETAKRLCDIDEVVALKEATGNILRTLDVFEQCGDRLTLLSGDDFVVAPFIASGGRGVVSVSSNVVPRLMADLVAAALAGDFKKAVELQLKLQPLHRALFCESNPIPVKMALHLMGRFSPDLRPPLFPMSEANTPKLKAELQKLGVVK